MNAYAYTNHDPFGAVDPDGLQCLTIGNKVNCATTFGDGTKIDITFPRPEDAFGFAWPATIPEDPALGWHRYDMRPSIGVGDCTSADLMPGIIKEPTPGLVTHPATRAGADNNANPAWLEAISFIHPPTGAAVQHANPIKSYLINDNITNQLYVVNVTQPGHSLWLGYVARTVTDTEAGSIVHNYGEGLGWLQSDESPQRVRDAINSVWIGMSDDVINNANCSCK